MFIVLKKSQEESRQQLAIVTFSLSDHKQRHIQDPHKHPRWRVLLQQKRLKAMNLCYKVLHLRYWQETWKRTCIFSKNSYWIKAQITVDQKNECQLTWKKRKKSIKLVEYYITQLISVIIQYSEYSMLGQSLEFA